MRSSLARSILHENPHSRWQHTPAFLLRWTGRHSPHWEVSARRALSTTPSANDNPSFPRAGQDGYREHSPRSISLSDDFRLASNGLFSYGAGTLADKSKFFDDVRRLLGARDADADDLCNYITSSAWFRKSLDPISLLPGERDVFDQVFEKCLTLSFGPTSSQHQNLPRVRSLLDSLYRVLSKKPSFWANSVAIPATTLFNSSSDVYLHPITFKDAVFDLYSTTAKVHHLMEYWQAFFSHFQYRAENRFNDLAGLWRWLQRDLDDRISSDATFQENLFAFAPRWKVGHDPESDQKLFCAAVLTLSLLRDLSSRLPNLAEEANRQPVERQVVPRRSAWEDLDISLLGRDERSFLQIMAAAARGTGINRTVMRLGLARLSLSKERTSIVEESTFDFLNSSSKFATSQHHEEGKNEALLNDYPIDDGIDSAVRSIIAWIKSTSLEAIHQSQADFRDLFKDNEVPMHYTILDALCERLIYLTQSEKSTQILDDERELQPPHYWTLFLVKQFFADEDPAVFEELFEHHNLAENESDVSLWLRILHWCWSSGNFENATRLYQAVFFRLCGNVQLEKQKTHEGRLGLTNAVLKFCSENWLSQHAANARFFYSCLLEGDTSPDAFTYRYMMRIELLSGHPLNARMWGRAMYDAGGEDFDLRKESGMYLTQALERWPTSSSTVPVGTVMEVIDWACAIWFGDEFSAFAKKNTRANSNDSPLPDGEPDKPNSDEAISPIPKRVPPFLRQQLDNEAPGSSGNPYVKGVPASHWRCLIEVYHSLLRVIVEKAPRHRVRLAVIVYEVFYNRVPLDELPTDVRKEATQLEDEVIYMIKKSSREEQISLLKGKDSRSPKGDPINWAIVIRRFGPWFVSSYLKDLGYGEYLAALGQIGWPELDCITHQNLLQAGVVSPMIRGQICDHVERLLHEIRSSRYVNLAKSSTDVLEKGVIQPIPEARFIVRGSKSSAGTTAPKPEPRTEFKMVSDAQIEGAPPPPHRTGSASLPAKFGHGARVRPARSQRRRGTANFMSPQASGRDGLQKITPRRPRIQIRPVAKKPRFNARRIKAKGIKRKGGRVKGVYAKDSGARLSRGRGSQDRKVSTVRGSGRKKMS